MLLAHIANLGKAGTNVGNTVEVRDFKYADDVAAVWSSREAMQRGMPKLVSHGRRWGLEVHVANAVDKASKTEFLVIPQVQKQHLHM